MQILAVTSGYPPEHSGSGLRLHELYRRLAASHPDLSWRVVTRRRDRGSAAPWGPERIGFFSAPWSDHLAYAPIQAAREWMAFRREIRRGLLSEVQLVHSVGFTWFTVFLAGEAKRRGVPFVREMTSQADTGTGSGLGAWLFSRVIRRLNAAADLLIAISPRLEQEARSTGIETPIWCRPNPVDTARFRPLLPVQRRRMRDALLAASEWADDSLVVLSIGRIRPNKNQLLLVHALSALPERFKLWLVGPAYGEDRDYLTSIQQAAASQGLEGRVRFEPSFRTDVERLMGISDIFALPSKREGLGNVVLEALCVGLPVAASRLPGVTDWIVEPGRNGFLFDLNTPDAAEAIRAASELRGRRKTIARVAASRFDSSVVDREYWTRLNRVVRERAS